ncbi:hypothetical protein HDU81_006199 [Chytriomyces hyalinus]|nr:hypothetical protein HDU81_006199 [Chytriomyces hyalinus]
MRHKLKDALASSKGGCEKTSLALAHFHASINKGVDAVRFFTLARNAGIEANTVSTSNAAYHIAFLHRNGCGDLPPSNSLSIEWITRAATDGNDSCWMILGDWHMQNSQNPPSDAGTGEESESDQDAQVQPSKNTFQERSVKLALKAWSTGAKRDNLECILRLASYYMQQKNFQAALKMYQRGSDKFQDPECVRMLAQVHSVMVSEVIEDGCVVAGSNSSDHVVESSSMGETRLLKKRKRNADQHLKDASDSEEADGDFSSWSASKIVAQYLKYCNLAATQDDTPSLLSLASSTSTGLKNSSSETLLLSRDTPRALSLYLKAFEKGAPPASLYAAAKLLFEGSENLARDRVRAMDLFLVAARAGCGQFSHLGDLLVQGNEEDTGQSEVESRMRAIKVYEEGCTAGEAECFVKLGDCLRLGLGCEKDVFKAFSLYERGMRMFGDLQATERVAFCLHNGEGCIKDKRRSRALLESIGRKDAVM